MALTRDQLGPNLAMIAVEKAIHAASSIKDKDSHYKQYLAAVDGKSNTYAREVAKDIVGEEVYWNWDRTSLGCYKLQGLLMTLPLSTADTRRLLPLYRRCRGVSGRTTPVLVLMLFPQGCYQASEGLRSLR